MLAALRLSSDPAIHSPIRAGKNARPSAVNRAMPDHTPAFRQLRDAILDELQDDDRRRLAALLGYMTEPQQPLSTELVRVLHAIVKLDDAELRRLSKWFSSYVNRWGQVPVASSQRVPNPRGGAPNDRRKRPSAVPAPD